MYKNLTKVGTKKNTQYNYSNRFRVWICKWLHTSVANPYKLAAIQVKANTLSQVCWFIISEESRLQISRHWLFWSGICFGNCSCNLWARSSAALHVGVRWLRDWSLYVLWLQIMLSSPINWTKPMPTPFCFLVTNSHCKKVSTCVMAKAKAIPKCFSCKILECCLQCQWVLVTSFGVGSLSSFGWIRWGDWYQKPWINLKSFYYLAWFVKGIKYRFFPFRKPICMRASQIFIN